MIWFVFYKIIFDRFDIKRFLVLIKEVVVLLLGFYQLLFCFVLRCFFSKLMIGVFEIINIVILYFLLVVKIDEKGVKMYFNYLLGKCDKIYLR